MGINFRIAFAHYHRILKDVKEELEREGFEFAPFPNIDRRLVGFPRDLAIRLTEKTLLISPDSGIIFPKRISGQRLVKSFFGEGGRIFFRKDTVLVSELIYPEKQPILKAQVKLFKKRGLKVGILPNTIFFEDDSPVEGYIFEDHLDRTSGLLEDSKGCLHLVVDPQLHSGYMGPFMKPKYGPKETIEKFRRICNKLKINLHIPEKLTIPASVGFIQFETGQVLMTGGDDEVAEIVADIVGSKNVFTTPIPIKHYPTWNKAAVRCLIGEFPLSFVELCEQLTKKQ